MIATEALSKDAFPAITYYITIVCTVHIRDYEWEIEFWNGNARVLLSLIIQV